MTKAINYGKKCRDCKFYREDYNRRARGYCTCNSPTLVTWRRERYGKDVACKEFVHRSVIIKY